MVSAPGGRGLVPLRLACQQSPCIGVLRPRECRVAVSGFHHFALLHHHHAVGYPPHDAEVVRDEDERHAQPLLKRFEQRQYFRLDGDVQRRGRLVGNQQVRIVGDRQRDHDALPLPAGKFVRVSAHSPLRLWYLDQLQQFQRLGICRRSRNALVVDDGLQHLLANAEQRVERGHRLLEDHAHLAAAHRVQCV